jgi:hypothetical protein
MIVDGIFIRMVEEMKNAVVRHEKMLTTTLVRHKEEMESMMGCLKKIEQKFFEM